LENKVGANKGESKDKTDAGGDKIKTQNSCPLIKRKPWLCFGYIDSFPRSKECFEKKCDGEIIGKKSDEVAKCNKIIANVLMQIGKGIQSHI